MPAGLEAFYGQQLEWTDCGDSECSELTVPVDYGQPDGDVVNAIDGRASATFDMGLPVEAFEAAMMERSTGILGPLTLASRRTLWPIVAQEAERLTAERVALVAEAAHVMPPIGAQGLNMSLRDLDLLLTLTEDHQDDIGGRQMLDAYERARRPDIALRVGGIAMLNRMSQAEYPGMRDLRALGLGALHDLAPVRRTLMQLGLGTGPR